MALMGIGTDIVEVARIAAFAAKPGALERIFSAEEIAYCRARKNCSEHLAVRFAAKEAVYKALPFGGVAFKNIAVHNGPDGEPRVDIADERCKNLRVLISLSHTQNYAVATAVVENA